MILKKIHFALYHLGMCIKKSWTVECKKLFKPHGYNKKI